MTAIPLLVPNEPAQWVLLDLQGDISLRRTAQGGGNPSTERPQPNAIHTYGGLELGVFKQHNGKLQLRIGNHMLNCQLVALKKPFLVLRRARHLHNHPPNPTTSTQRSTSDMQTDSDSDDEPSSGGRRVEGAGAGGEEEVGLHCVAVIRHKVLVNTRPVPIIVGQTGPMPVLT